MRMAAVSLDFSAHSLSPPVVKAIDEGQYTADQIKTLIKQKEKVSDIILGAAGRPPTSSTSTTTSSSSEGTFSILPQSTTFSTNSTASLDEEIKAAYDWKELQKVWMSQPAMPPPDCQYKAPVSGTPEPPGGPTLPTLPTDQICDFKVCPNCRPTYRERAYQSLDHILSDPVRLPPIWELENRRVSDARIVAQIGQPALSRFYTVATAGSFRSDKTVLEMGGGREDASTPSPQIDENHSVRRRSGFRDTVRKALARAKLEDLPPLPSTSDPGPGQDSNVDRSRPSRSLIFRRGRSRPTLSFVEAHGRVVDTSSLQDSVMLMLATNTPLPHTPTISSHQLSQLIEQRSEPSNLATTLRSLGLLTHV
ncbi:hypothetical protein A1O1_02653 [Capronia coronata CBS 617.96]|uniref:Uncharacterized protein n=1 Tax=Capronia coronata CBS 617.96 TaxID=1182541 RepID=W9YX35_9EURO|nr:uncharacterized protein A1O1_02653 [Capronia coronata CBS 617.96]EXJ94260.1 hypothetical protein A1O1_02653 [Capronia coronata CBS 617.96]